MKNPEQEDRELRRANEILKRASCGGARPPTEIADQFLLCQAARMYAVLPLVEELWRIPEPTGPRPQGLSI